MGDNEKNICEYVKKNYEISEEVDDKINLTFENLKEKEGCCDMKRVSVIGKIVASLVVLFLGGNIIALACGGNNIYTMIFEFFKPNEEEKIDSVILEGGEEKVDYIGLKSSIGYTIQYDDESLNLVRSGDKDIYMSNIDEIKDKVYFEIYHVDTAYSDLKSGEIEEFEINGNDTFVTTLIDGKEYNENSNYNWDSDILETWHIDAGKGTYIIEVHYFMEATEGWGTRISNMIQSFKIVETGEGK